MTARLVIALVLLLVLAPAAGAAPIPVGGATFLIDFSGGGGPGTGSFPDQMSGNCVLVSGLGWFEDYDGRKGAWGSGSGSARGAIDVARGRGDVTTRGSALQFDAAALEPGERRHSMKLTDVGFELAGRRGYLTGRFTRAAPRIAAGARMRLGVVSRPKLLTGQLHDPDDRSDVPGTYGVAVQGTLRLTQEFARALDRQRCGPRWASQNSGPVRAGRKVGRLTIQFKAAAATGLVGTMPVVALFDTVADEPVPVAVTDASGTPATSRGELKLPTVPGQRTALGCVLLTEYPGQACAPFGGAVALDGGIVLRLGDRATTLAGLTIAYGADARSDSFPSRTLTGTLDGVALTVAAATAGRSSLLITPDALARIGAALNAEVSGGVYPDLPVFSVLGPP